MSLDLLHVHVGQELPARVVHVDRERLVAYAEASGDDNPIHQDESFAHSVGLPDVIAHGMWTMGAAAELVSDWAGDPAAVVSYGTRFVNPVVVPAAGGADIEVSGKVSKVEEGTGRVTVELAVACGGTKVLGRARAVVQAPVAAP